MDPSNDRRRREDKRDQKYRKDRDRSRSPSRLDRRDDRRRDRSPPVTSSKQKTVPSFGRPDRTTDNNHNNNYRRGGLKKDRDRSNSPPPPLSHPSKSRPGDKQERGGNPHHAQFQRQKPSSAALTAGDGGKANNKRLSGTDIADMDMMDDHSGRGAGHEGEDEEGALMQKLLGFRSFRSTKNTKVPGNDRNYGIHKVKKTEYRQYMNRVGGFNRPLSPTRM